MIIWIFACFLLLFMKSVFEQQVFIEFLLSCAENLAKSEAAVKWACENNVWQDEDSN